MPTFDVSELPQFGKIPQMTREAGYQVHVSLRYLEDHLKRAFEEDRLELNPDFQRGHVWTEEQQIAYVEYVFRGGRSGRDFYFNHPGWMKDWVGEYVCVDGLQRLTALRRFLANEIPIFGYKREAFEDKVPNMVTIVWHVNNLKTRAEVLQWYYEMNAGSTPHTKEELERVKKMWKDAKEKGL
ncbi:DUF262 domain-containing protein [Cytobacillus sp. FJAT-54145]|uniref:DUF262 domain-containing protein n=1 Tax=Cytobacillus spartinae TaxID=3299023 RepID=A0ABW6KAA4_9BACI